MVSCCRTWFALRKAISFCSVSKVRRKPFGFPALPVSRLPGEEYHSAPCLSLNLWFMILRMAERAAASRARISGAAVHPDLFILEWPGKCRCNQGFPGFSVSAAETWSEASVRNLISGNGQGTAGASPSGADFRSRKKAGRILSASEWEYFGFQREEFFSRLLS